MLISKENKFLCSRNSFQPEMYVDYIFNTCDIHVLESTTE